MSSTPMRRAADYRRAFTLLELIIIFTIVCVLFALLGSVLVKARPKQKKIGCLNNLKNVGIAYRIFTTDNRDLFPWKFGTNPLPKTFNDVLWRFRVISNEISTPKILMCPFDGRKAATNWADLSRTNISYFVSLGSESHPQSFFAGDRNVLTNGVRIGPGIVKLDSTVTNVAWDGTIHRFQGNVLMVDGSLQQLSSARLRQQWTNTGQNSMTWAVP